MKFSRVLIALLACVPTLSIAGVGLKQSRVILNETNGSASLNIESKDEYPNLIESWISNASDNGKSADFIVTPPLFKLDGGDTAELKIVSLGGPLPTDRESMFYLNVKNVAQSIKSESKLQIAVNNRIKLLYRPASLAGLDMIDSTSKLDWQAAGGALVVKNNGPFVINFYSIAVNSKLVEGQYYVLPFSTLTINTKVSVGDNISWQVINDYGAPAGRGEKRAH